MSRKRWRLKLVPTFRYESAPSQVAAYRKVQFYREQYAVGRSRIHHVNVEVNDGLGWTLHERLVFPERPVDAS